MSHLKLMKLLYLADREAMNQFDAPISGDCVVAMPHGPVLSQTLNLMDGDVESRAGGWQAWISDKADNELSLKYVITRDDLDELSDADVEVLNATWQRFGHMDRWEIRDYTHHHCPEWRDPDGSSRPIPYEDIFRSLGRPDELAKALAAELEAERSVERLFASL